jgi:V8-like Glu-specific endopeptidase
MAAPQNEYAFDHEATRQAAEHWRLRNEERQRKTRAVRDKRYDDAETKERLTKWVNRTLRQVRGGCRAHPEALPDRLNELVNREPFTQDEVGNGLVEQVIGETRDFLAVAFLERALQAMRAVGRIETHLGQGRKGYATGFLVSPQLLLTNHHVLQTANHARNSVIEFDYQLDRIDQPLVAQRFALDPDTFFLNDAPLDFALVAVKPTSTRGRSLDEYGWCPLIKEEGKIRIGECINIVQHPRGEMKQIVIRENSLLDLPDNIDALNRFAHYEADTEPGSSGSPVFNDLWEVVALHHSGIPKTDANGRFLDKHDHVWQRGDDPGRLAWVANEGIRVSRLVDFIEKANIRAHEEPLRAELIANREPPLSPAVGHRHVPQAELAVPHLPMLPTSGTVSITLPLHITIGLSSPVLSDASKLGFGVARGQSIHAAVQQVTEVPGAIGSLGVASGAENILDPSGQAVWEEVPTERHQNRPYAAIGHVRVLRGGIEVQHGTCWLAHDNTAVTAAHIVERWGESGVSVEITFVGVEEEVPVVDVMIPEQYGQAAGPFDPWDMALLRLHPRSRLSLARKAGSGAAVRIIGFPFTGQKTMVEGRGTAVTPDAFVLLHRADTVPGHSGAPVLEEPGGPAARVIGLHIAGFNGNPHKIQHPKHNVALVLRPQLEALITERVAAWG